MKHRRIEFVVALTFCTAGQYVWVWIFQAKRAISRTERTFELHSGLAGITPSLVLLLIPIDLLIRIIFVAAPGFLQWEMGVFALILDIIASVMIGRLQVEMNRLIGEEPLPAISVPAIPQSAAFQPAVSNSSRPTPVTSSPAAPPAVAISGNDWQKGIATFDPAQNPVSEEIVNANVIPLSETASSGDSSDSPLNSSGSPELLPRAPKDLIQAPSAEASTVITPAATEEGTVIELHHGA